MRKILIMLFLVVWIFEIQACQNSGGDSGNKVIKKSEAKYYCPMDTAVTSDKPGKCPKCGMKLVAADSTKNK